MNDQLTQDQLRAMTASAPSPDASAGMLGHSNSILQNMLKGAQGFIGNPIEMGKDIANSALLFGESAAAASVDTARGVMGQQPLDTDMPAIGGSQKTIQAQASEDAGQVFEGKKSPMSAALSAVGNTVGGALNFVGGELFGKAAKEAAPAIVEGVSEAAQNRGVSVATKRLASTGETMTKAEREAAIKEGRMTARGKYTPSATEQRAGQIMKGKTYGNPVRTLKSVQGEIATRGKEAETYLEKNAIKVSDEESAAAFQSTRDSAEKYMTPAEASAYDEQIGVFQKVLKNQGGGGTTADYYKALKEYESQVTANLPRGKDALLVPGGSARVQAAKDVRSVVRNMIGEKNPEFKGKMFDLASLYDAQDNVISQAEKGGHSWAKRHPRLTTAAIAGGTVAAEQLGVEEVKKLLP